MLKNSIGNVTEIINLLDKKLYSGVQIQENYKYLIEKWGEWEIIGENGAGLVIRYVNIRNALFSGLMVTYCILSMVTIVCGIVFGKIVFPLLSKHYKNYNEEMVDLATLQSASQIEEMSRGNKEKKKEWF